MNLPRQPAAKISFRAPALQRDRAGALARCLPLSRSAVMREALRLGLDVLEEDPGAMLRKPPILAVKGEPS